MTHQLHDYVEMLIAAGWIDRGDTDPEYCEYKLRVSDPASYNDWLKDRLQPTEPTEANEEYQREIQPMLLFKQMIMLGTLLFTGAADD